MDLTQGYKGPVLFIIYIDDTDVGLNNFIAKFVDNTEIRKSIILDHYRQSLQEGIAQNFTIFRKMENSTLY